MHGWHEVCRRGMRPALPHAFISKPIVSRGSRSRPRPPGHGEASNRWRGRANAHGVHGVLSSSHDAPAKREDVGKSVVATRLNVTHDGEPESGTAASRMSALRDEGIIMQQTKRGFATWVLGLVVLVACTSTPDRPDTKSAKSRVGTVVSPVVAASTLPGTLGARVEKVCASTLPPGVERLLYGPNGAPSKTKVPRRVIPPPPAGKNTTFSTTAGRTSLATSKDKNGAARVSVGTHANDPSVVTRLRRNLHRCHVVWGKRG